MIQIRAALLSITLAAVALAAVALSIVPAPTVADTSRPTLADQAAMQAAMQRHIDRQAVGGVQLYLDEATGDVRALHPVTAHPMILTMGPHFVLCFDFRDDKGETVPIDYYMARNGSGYTVFHTAVGDRALLMKLMDSGRVQRLP